MISPHQGNMIFIRHIDYDPITHDVLTKVSTELFDRVAG